jgi:hypothetical protein
MVGDSMVVKADDTFPTEMEDDGTGADEDDGEDVEDMDETGYDGQGRLTRGILHQIRNLPIWKFFRSANSLQVTRTQLLASST